MRNVRDDAARSGQDIGGQLDPADYGPDAADEVTLPAADERREAHAHDIDDPADARVDPDVLRDGGPTRGHGAITTTGGRAGPANVHRRPRTSDRAGGRVAPTTTGDATTGGMDVPSSGSTSDQSGRASQIDNASER
ncbi:hypothetical protein [Plantactinospora sp. GCM10030261]|uniref:hypothetical protein n=1 Tax=Plantactinospora sp. GCM10030261 TaxID=3273420 RepID=UPI0036139ACA